jgi:hypothetical protein
VTLLMSKMLTMGERHPPKRSGWKPHESDVRGDLAVYLDIMRKVALEGPWPNVVRACCLAVVHGKVRASDPTARLRQWSNE